MRQGILPIEYAEVPRSGGVTALAGMLPYVDLVEASGLRSSLQRQLGASRTQGWSESQLSVSLLLLNLAGGESVDDLRILEQDEGLGQVVRHAELHGVRGRERRARARRWRRERRRSVPSPSALFRYLESFHDASQESLRLRGRAFIPAPGAALRGLQRVNADLMRFVQRRAPQEQATLDMDATLVETSKRTALVSYEGTRAYQPLTTYWAEAGLVVHSEFRDGNVPAGHEQLRVLDEVLEHLPAGVERVLLRSDTAGYQWELLRYCAAGRSERFGVIEFAVGVDVSASFRAAVSEVEEAEWRELCDGEGEATGQEYAEVCFVPNAVGHSVNGPEYRFLAVREPLRNPPLPGMDEVGLPAVELGGEGWFRIRGVVTNRTLEGSELVRWYRARCGKGEEVHGVMKTDLAGGRLPSGRFGANTAWWAHVVLAFNLHAALRRLGLGPEWAGRRMKAVRFSLLGVPGRVVGLRELADAQLDLGDAAGRANLGDKLMTLIASALAGGDCIDDADAMRSGGAGRVLGCTVKAPSTLGTFLRSFRWGHVRQLDRVSRELLARSWAAGAGPGAAPFTIDLDSTLCETYGLAKEGARHHGYTGVRGYHPLLAVAAGTGEVLMARLRGGRANTARGAAHFLRETVARVRDAGASGQLTLRADSHAVVAACRKQDVRFSITIRQQPNVRRLIEAIPQEDWTPIPYWLPGGAAVAETTYTPFQHTGDATAVRLIVRRVTPTPGSQLALFVDYSYHAFITNRAGEMMELEADHRRHAEIENAIRDLKYGVGLNHLPSGRFAANAAWLAVQVIAHNLARWTARLGLGEGTMTTRTLRRRYFSLAGRLTRSARRWTLHLPKRWPWAEQLAAALARLRAIPLPA